MSKEYFFINAKLTVQGCVYDFQLDLEETHTLEDALEQLQNHFDVYCKLITTNRKTTMKQTRNTYRVRETGSEDTVILQLERTTAERAKKYVVAFLLKVWGPDAEIHSVDVELLPS